MQAKQARKTYVEIIADDQHWCITASTLALDLDHREFTVFRRFARCDAAELGTDGVEDIVCAAEHAWCGCADLDKVLADGFPRVDKHHVSPTFNERLQYARHEK